MNTKAISIISLVFIFLFITVMIWGWKLCELPDSKPAINKLLIKAAMIGDLKKVRNYVQRGGDVNVKDMNGWTPLHYAAAQNRPELTRYLIHTHADLNSTSKYNQTPLHIAATTRYLVNVELLVSNGAKVNIEDLNHKSPLIYCLSSSDYRYSIADYLIKKHAVLNTSEAEYCPLYYALKTGDMKIIIRLALLTRLDIINNINPSILIWALNHHEEDLVSLLLNRGIRTKQKDSSEESCLAAALLTGNDRVLKSLIQHGADVDGISSDGNSSLSIAITTHNMNFIRLLLSHKVNVNIANKQGITPLMFAVKSGNVELVHLLLKHGAITTIKDHTNKTASQWAREYGQDQLLTFLR